MLAALELISYGTVAGMDEGGAISCLLLLCAFSLSGSLFLYV